MFSIFEHLYLYFKGHKVTFYVLFFLLFGLVAVGISTIKFEEDFTKVLPFRKEVKVYNDVLSNSDFINRIIFTISFSDEGNNQSIDSLVKFTSSFADSARHHLLPEFVKEIQYQAKQNITGDLFNTFFNHMPLYFSKKDYHRIDHLLQEDSLQKVVYQTYKTLLSPSGMVARNFLLKDPLNLVFPKMQILHDIRVDERMKLYNGYFLAPESKQLFLFMVPIHTGDTRKQKEFIARLDAQISNFKTIYPGIDVHYYGAAAIAVANANQIEKDIKFTVSLVLILLLVWLATFFRSARAVVLVFLPVLLGALTGMAALAYLTETVSILSVAIGAVILGITIDYTLHLVTHYKMSGNIPASIHHVAQPIIMSSLTTGTAFLCLVFLTSKILRDLGIFASFSVLGAALSAILIIPQLLHKLKSDKSKNSSHWLEKAAATPLHKKRWLAAIVTLITILLIPFMSDVGFEGDLEKSNYLSPELKRAKEKIDSTTNINQQLIYVFSNGDNLNQALIHAEEANPLLKNSFAGTNEAKIFSIIRLVSSEEKQRQKIEVWNNFWTPEKKTDFKIKLEEASEKYGFKKDVFTPLLSNIEKTYHPVPPTELVTAFEGLVNNFIIPHGDSVLVTTLVRSSDSEIKKTIYSVTSTINGTTAFDRKRITEQLFAFLKEDFNRLVSLSLGVVFIILLLFFGRIELAVVTYIPILLSYAWTLGIMGMAGIKFNIFNIIISTFIFGLGVDYAIFITKGILNEYKSAHKDLVPFKASILLSAISTLAGVGALIFAKHPALQSIALLSIVGIVSVLMISFIIQPILISFIVPHTKGRRKTPLTLRTLLFSVAAFLFFGISSLILSVLGIILRIIPIPGKPVRHFYNYLLCYSNKFLIKMYILVKKRYINYDKKSLRQPQIIVANHQSVIDLLLILSLSPKVIMLVKDWVWNSFFFGSVVRTAGYINTSEGYEKSLPKIRKRLDEGYSIVVFPEGSRTRTGKIKRFHKGAFYMARELKVPVTPLLFHGAFEILPPGQFIVSNKVMTMKFLPAIKVHENTVGTTYQQDTKAIQGIMRDAYQNLKNKYENVEFYKSDLINNYIYKGPVIENYQRVKFRMEEYYARFHKIIPAEARIYDYGCGMGSLSIMLSYLSANRTITGVDYDEKKIEIAGNCTYEKGKVNFIHADILTFQPGEADIFVLSDVLHYLTHENQQKLMDRIIHNLKAGGRIIIRDGNITQKEKHRMTRFSEFLSTNIGFNKKSQDFNFISDTWLQKMSEKYNLSLELEHSSRITSNQVYIFTKPPENEK